MGFVRTLAKGSAAAALGAGVLLLTPVSALADCRPSQGNHHQAVNTHTQEHVVIHKNSHINVHTQLHETFHESVHVQQHVNIQENQHLNIHVNNHENVQIDTKNLQFALQDMGCAQGDRLIQYLETCHWTEKDVQQIQIHIHDVDQFMVKCHDKTHLSATERVELWQLICRVCSDAHLTLTGCDAHGQPVQLPTCNGSGGGEVDIQVKGQNGKVVATVTSPKAPSSPPVTSVRTTSSSQASPSSPSTPPQSTKAAASSNQGELPHTATQDPLMMVIGGLIAILGVIAGFVVYTVRRQRQNGSGGSSQ